MTDHVLRDRRFGQLESELQEFAVDAWRAPTRVGQAHLLSSIGSLKDQELMPEGENLSVERKSAAKTPPE